MKKILLTGATGLVGGNVLGYFHSLGWHIYMATSSAGAVSNSDHIEIIPFDLKNVADNSKLAAALKNADAVIHAAALIPQQQKRTDTKSGSELLKINSIGTMELACLAASYEVKNFIYISTTNMFGKAEQIDEDMKPEPHDFYSLSKFLGERAVEYAQRTSKMKCCSLRIRAPYGAGYKIKAVVPIFTENALQGLDIELWGGGLHQQIFTYVRDIAHACEQVIRCGATGTYNITGPGPVTMKELAETIVCAAGADSKIIFNGRSDPNENMKIAISSEAAKKAFGYSPQYDIEAGIVEMIGLIREPPRALHSLQEVKSYG